MRIQEKEILYVDILLVGYRHMRHGVYLAYIEEAYSHFDSHPSFCVALEKIENSICNKQRTHLTPIKLSWLVSFFCCIVNTVHLFSNLT